MVRPEGNTAVDPPNAGESNHSTQHTTHDTSNAMQRANALLREHGSAQLSTPPPISAEDAADAQRHAVHDLTSITENNEKEHYMGAVLSLREFEYCKKSGSTV